MGEGYSSMSERGRAVCEYLELSMRHDVLKRRQGSIVGYKVPQGLIEDLKIRFEQLSDEEKAAVSDLRIYEVASRDTPRWRCWLEQHLNEHPGDAHLLLFVEKTFAPYYWSEFIRTNYGLNDRPWLMNHTW